MTLDVSALYLPYVYHILEFFGLSTGAFSQLTRCYMTNTFNPSVPNDPSVRYFSYGASNSPSVGSSFRQSHRIVEAAEGANDGLVSVASSRWGDYKGTLADVNHLDLINWTNRIRWLVWELTGNRRKSVALKTL